MTLFVTGRTGKTKVSSFLCIITRGVKGLKIREKIYRVEISRYLRFLRLWSGPKDVRERYCGRDPAAFERSAPVLCMENSRWDVRHRRHTGYNRLH